MHSACPDDTFNHAGLGPSFPFAAVLLLNSGEKVSVALFFTCYRFSSFVVSSSSIFSCEIDEDACLYLSRPRASPLFFFFSTDCTWGELEFRVFFFPPCVFLFGFYVYPSSGGCPIHTFALPLDRWSAARRGILPNLSAPFPGFSSPRDTRFS